MLYNSDCFVTNTEYVDPYFLCHVLSFSLVGYRVMSLCFSSIQVFTLISFYIHKSVCFFVFFPFNFFW